MPHIVDELVVLADLLVVGEHTLLQFAVGLTRLDEMDAVGPVLLVAVGWVGASSLKAHL